MPALRESDRIEQPVRPLPGIGLSQQFQREQDVLPRGQVAQQLNDWNTKPIL